VHFGGLTVQPDRTSSPSTATGEKGSVRWVSQIRPGVRKAIRNVGALFGWQVAQYVVPLITLPFLARTLGLSAFGELSVVTSLTAYLLILTEWGFALTATQQVAKCQADPDELGRVFWDTILAKTLVAVPATFVAAGLVWLLPQTRGMTTLFLYSSVQVLANVATVNWFLQGTEDMVGFTGAALAGRLVTIPLVFWVVRGPQDVTMVVGIQSCGAILTAVLSLVLVRRSVSLLSPTLSFRRALRQLTHGWDVFMSQAAATLYAQSNVIVISLICGNTQAGLYAGADKIRRAAQGMLSPISTALYPRINNLAVRDENQALDLVRQATVVQLAMSAFLSVALFWGAPAIVYGLLGRGFGGAIPVVRILSCVPLLAAMSNAMAIQVMLAFGLKKEMSRAILFAGIANVVVLVPLAFRYGAIGGAFALLLAELCVVFVTSKCVYQRFGRRPFPSFRGSNLSTSTSRGGRAVSHIDGARQSQDLSSHVTKDATAQTSQLDSVIG
jgi:PST family polysaccharide transporter